MFNKVSKQIAWGRHMLTIETAEIARQAAGAALVKLDDTVVLLRSEWTDVELSCLSAVPLMITPSQPICGPLEEARLPAAALRARPRPPPLVETRGLPRQRPGPLRRVPHPEGLAMIEDLGRHMAGGPHPGGEGKVPSLRGLVAREKYEDVSNLTLALQNGEELGYEDLSSGGMGAIQESLAKLPESDVRAIAEYLLSLK